MEVTREQLVNAAKELNEVLGLEPAIDLHGHKEYLASMLLEAAELIEPEDDISSATKAVLEVLATPKRESKPLPRSKPKNEVAGKKKKVTKLESSDAGAKKVSWSQAMSSALKATRGKEFTPSELIQMAAKIYREENHLPNVDPRGARVEWRVVYRILIYLGVIQRKGNNKYVFTR